MIETIEMAFPDDKVTNCLTAALGIVALLEATGPVIVPSYSPDVLRNHHANPSSSPGETDRGVEAGFDFAAMTRQRLDAGSQDIHRELASIAENQIFAEVLQQTDGNLTQSAKRLGITRTTLRARLESLGMSLEKSATIS